MINYMGFLPWRNIERSFLCSIFRLNPDEVAVARVASPRIILGLGRVNRETSAS